MWLRSSIIPRSAITSSNRRPSGVRDRARASRRSSACPRRADDAHAGGNQSCSHPAAGRSRRPRSAPGRVAAWRVAGPACSTFRICLMLHQPKGAAQASAWMRARRCAPVAWRRSISPPWSCAGRTDAWRRRRARRPARSPVEQPALLLWIGVPVRARPAAERGGARPKVAVPGDIFGVDDQPTPTDLTHQLAPERASFPGIGIERQPSASPAVALEQSAASQPERRRRR
jgi:hypothetical protein